MSSTTPFPRVIDFDGELCADLRAAEAREWLVTNGLGGFACGTIAGILTRRYHGLLVAALPPPFYRTLLVSKVEEAVEYNGANYALGANRWASGAIDPSGYRHLTRFRLDGTTPVWTFACADARLEKRVWMEHGANTTYVQYTVVDAKSTLDLSIRVMANWRGYHCLTRGQNEFIEVQTVTAGLRLQAGKDAPPFFLRSTRATAEPAHTWYRDYELTAENTRGLDHVEDHLHCGTFHCEVKIGDTVTLVFSANQEAGHGAMARQRQSAREEMLLGRALEHLPDATSPEWIEQLTLAADQFLVKRPLAAERSSCSSIIAGYPWFSDWGRDTMIALPGLLLATGRSEVAADVLRTYARFVDKGMLPNRFPDAGEAPEYNSVDAALWFVEAVHKYFAATSDIELVREIFPVLAQIIEHYTNSTRYNIHRDPADGLLYAGEPGVQLTWMDSKIGDWVVTPRTGKAVEVNALWLNALSTLANFAEALGEPAAPHRSSLAVTRKGFQRFWNPSADYCFDVIDGPDGNSDSLRPNQLLAVSLEESPLTSEQQRRVVEVCSRELVTPFGLRSLSPRDPQYHGHYGGDQRHRDAAYHQGTAWGWLIGPFVDAVLRVSGGDTQLALNLLAPFEDHLKIHGLGTASEIFDGDPPYTPQGCFAQAWTVGEILRAWAGIERMRAHDEGSERREFSDSKPIAPLPRATS